MSRKTTIRDIAGFCPEDAIWKMMYDISGLLIQDEDDYVLTPDSVVIDGQMFIVEDNHDSVSEFIAPEHKVGHKPNAQEQVWTLGAIAYYVATGHIVFGGYGGRYQKEHPLIALPILPKGLLNLTSVLHQCLCYTPEERINLKKLNDLSQAGLLNCEQIHRQELVLKEEEIKENKKQCGEKWPEKMIKL